MTGHIELGTLAELAEGTLAPAEASVARSHLERCRSCMAAYVDAVRYRAAWLADSDAFEADHDARRWAAHHEQHPASLPRRGSGGTGARLLQIAAAVAIVAWLGMSRFTGEAPSLTFELPPAIREAAERASSHGLVLPGAAAGAERLTPDFRSGRPATQPRLDREVRATIEQYERGARGPESGARVVAALLAVGEIEAAHEYAREALRRFPDDVALLVFAADARYRSNDIPGAERLLRNAARRAPNDPLVALDLGIVLKQTGRGDEARPLLVRASRSSTRGLAGRAARELSRADRSDGASGG